MLTPHQPMTSLRMTAYDEGEQMLARWAQDMRASNRSPRTITERTNLVARAARSAGVDAHLLTVEHVAAFLAASPPRARVTYYAHLNAFFVWLVRQEIREDVPTMKLDRPKLGRTDPKTISTAHVRDLVASSIWGRTRTMVLLGAYAGMRASEIATMHGAAIDATGGNLTIHGKGDVTRVVPLHPLIRAEADKYTRGWWFPSGARPGRPMLAASVSQVISDAMDRLRIPGTCHDLRRWYATSMSEAGHSLTTIQRLLGHSSVATTQRYIVVGQQQLLDAVLSLPDVTQPGVSA